MEGAQPAAGRAPVTPEVTARRSRRASPVAPLVLGALILGLAILDALLGFAAHKRGFGVGLAILSVAALGLVVARRQPGNPIGWLLMGFSTGLVCYDAVAHYAVIDYHFHHGDLPLGPAAALIASELWIVFFLVLPVVILLFPDGRLTPRWRMTLWAYLAVCALITAILLGSGAWQMSGIRIVVDGKGQLVPNPGATSALAIPFIILLASVPVFWASFVVRQGLSWRRATGERRQQLKWLMAGSTLSVAGLAATFLLAQLSSPLAAALANGMLGIGLFSLPAGLSIGILKYRLYDIDRLISRTLSYTLVTGLLVGVYAGIVTLATEVLPFSSPVAVAASTLAVAALFNPLRRRVQRTVDRRFNRARYDADETVAAFAARLQDAVDLDSVRDDLAAVVQQVLEPARVTVWMRERG
ncbi:MAG TPA: hypothetical protein VLW44_12780 [Streptosporangiaceae bacterium]|nr:hypothetical protein [Streptosporangiaceae bacterium]